MNFIRNLKITHQFLIVFGVLVIGFAAVGLAYRQVLEVEQASAQQVRQTNEFGELVNLLAADIARMTAAETGFLLTRDMQHVESFEKLILKAEQNIGRMEKVIPEQQVQELVTELRSSLGSFGATFQNLVNNQKQLGLSENLGLHGKLRKAVHSIEATLNELRNDTLRASMLMMRRHEKDFIQRGTSKYLKRMKQEQATFAGLLNATTIAGTAKAAITNEMATYAKSFDSFANGAVQLEKRHDELNKALGEVLQPLLDSLLIQKDALVAANLETVAAERARINLFFIAAMITAGGVVVSVLFFVAFRMRRSVGTLHGTVQKVAAGDFTARSQLETGDELGALGNAFDTLLDERVATLAEVERERDTLNDSIITLMGSVAKLSQKDLTVKAVVAEDVTGPVSDAVNLMTSETTKVLSQIRDLSQDVEQAAKTVRSQAEKMTQVATQERQLVQKSADELKQAGKSMAQLARGAKGANDMAGAAMEQTRGALEAVSTTVSGIEKIREIIRETEKRIKRLGERSQEITGAVNLINTIAERTHILALNASMHAASAGEAGRGFAVVADEVQRLAESSREATSDIASMVNAIRVETADTVDTMNRVIAQVAEGTQLAQEAGERMGQTETTTAELVASVQKIAMDAERQVRTALELVKRSEVIVKSSEQTSDELREQSTQTVSLVDYSNALRESVDVFKLPAAAA